MIYYSLFGLYLCDDQLLLFLVSYLKHSLTRTHNFCKCMCNVHVIVAVLTPFSRKVAISGKIQLSQWHIYENVTLLGHGGRGSKRSEILELFATLCRWAMGTQPNRLEINPINFETNLKNYLFLRIIQ